MWENCEENEIIGQDRRINGCMESRNQELESRYIQQSSYFNKDRLDSIHKEEKKKVQSFECNTLFKRTIWEAWAYFQR
jgi:hypothetical protein